MMRLCGARGSARGAAWSFVVAAILSAAACADDEPFVPYIGIVDATPARLGRPLTVLLPSEAGAEAAIEASADGDLDAGARAEMAQDTGSGEEISDGSASADSEAAPE